MKFSVDAQVLKKAIKTVKGAASKGVNHMPVLKCAKITVSNWDVTIASTDLEVFMALEIEGAKGERDGAAVVEIKALETAVKALEGNVSLRVDGETLEVRTAASSINLPMRDESEFPFAPVLPDAELIRVDALDGLRAAFEAVFHAVSKDETRYNLNGIALESETHATARCIATDGHRLCIADAGPISLPWEGTQIIPLKSAKLLAKLLKASGDRASVSAAGQGDGKTLGFAGSGYQLIARAIDGEFPNYKQVVPKAIGETIAVDRDAMLVGLETVSAAWQRITAAQCKTDSRPAREAGWMRAVKVTFNGGILLESTNSETDATSSATVDASRGEPETVKELCFNGRYLQDALKTLPKGTVRFGIAGGEFRGGSKQPPEYASSPVQLQSEGAFPLCVVMPMRL